MNHAQWGVGNLFIAMNSEFEFLVNPLFALSGWVHEDHIFFLCWIWVTLQLRLSQLCSLSLYVDAEGSSLLVVLGVISSLHFPSTKDQFISPTSLLIFRIYLLFCIASISLIEGLLCSIPCFHLVLTQHRRRFCSTGRDKKIYKIEKDMKCTFWLFLLVPLWFLNC